NALTPYQKRKQQIIEEAKRNINVPTENSALGHSQFVSARSLPRRVLAAVINGDHKKMKELMDDPRMPIDSLTTQY
ncbi:hypothetical protein PFISCL1PPCAC_28458, partial [Pristionchus fissidentatus]